MTLNHKEEAVLDLIQQHEAHEGYFFRKADNTKWFFPLKERGFFDPSKAPRPRPAARESFFVIPEWNVLSYLERVSRQAGGQNDGTYVNELLGIIREVSLFNDAEGRHVDNYRTWWYFLKILVNLPNTKIPTNVIDLIPIWLSSSFDTSLPGAEILNKLLPKFLSESSTAPDIKKVARILRHVTRLKAVKKDRNRAGFIGQERYAFRIEHYWLEQAFEKYGKPIGEKCSSEVVKDLSGKMCKMLRDRDGKISVDGKEGRYLLVVRPKRDHTYSLRLFEMGKGSKSTTYEEAFDEIVKGKKQRRKLVIAGAVTSKSSEDFLRDVRQALKPSPVLKDYPREKLNGGLYGLYITLHAAETYSSFYEETEHHKDSATDLLTLGLKKILLAKALTDREEMRQILRDYFHSEYLYFSKMALYLIGNTGKAYIDIFWEHMESEDWRNAFDSFACEDELRHVLQTVAADLSEEHKQILTARIDEGPAYVAGEDEDRWIATWKQERYEALAAEPYFGCLNIDLKAKTGYQAQLRPAVSGGATWIGPGPSPIPKEDMLKISNGELADFLLTFEQTGHWEGPTYRGLAEILKQAVQERPKKFTDDLTPFLNSAYLYVDYIVWGLRDAWASKTPVDWGRVLGFLRAYIDRSEFRDNRLPIVGERSYTPDHENVAGMVAELIQEGSKDDTWALGEAHFDEAKEVLCLALESLSGPTESEGDYGDCVTYALNSAWGKALSAIIHLALRMVRADEKPGIKNDVKWDVDLRNLLQTSLFKKIIEAYTWLGYFLPQICYMDSNWAEAKVIDMQRSEVEPFWEAFMDGYLYANRAYDNVYDLMRPHYGRGIRYQFKNTHDAERLVHHICIAYLRGREEMTDEHGLFADLLDVWNYSQIREIVNFFVMQRNFVAEGTLEARAARVKIIAFWKYVYERYQKRGKATLDNDDRLLLSDVAKLIAALEEIDKESTKWLMLSVPYVQENFNAFFFIEALNELKERGDREETARYIGQLFLEMLGHITPDFDAAHIKSIVEFLYENGASEQATTICNTYGAKGYEFLRPIYNEYNKRSRTPRA